MLSTSSSRKALLMPDDVVVGEDQRERFGAKCTFDRFRIEIIRNTLIYLVVSTGTLHHSLEPNLNTGRGVNQGTECRGTMKSAKLDVERVETSARKKG